MGKVALVIIDVQNFYFFGKDALEGNRQAGLNARRVLDRFRERELPVFHVRHVFDRSNPTEEEKRLMEIHECVRPVQGEAIIEKKTPGSFKGTGLLEQLKDREITELVICGMMTQMCVDTTTREAFDLDFRCTVIHDACATRSFQFGDTVVPAAMVHASALAALQFAFAKVKSCEEILAEI